ncbi:hypothetical protein BGZ49_000743 [Haplosporangium sp. Z 27]|nr:hypothetical protein BGZ49_000743 [Haplosporangium sp. Z 27]
MSGTITPPMTESQIRQNMEYNQLSLPLPSAIHSSSPSVTFNIPNNPRYPGIPRFTPPSSGRKSGSTTPVYPPPTHHSTYNPQTYSNRVGTKSASNSPPGTPPSELRNYYLNAAYYRSQSRLYGVGPVHNSSASSHRPTLSLSVPQQNTHPKPSRPDGPQRSHSDSNLKIEEPEIMVTSPGGTNSTESHVISLDRALSKLAEAQGRRSVEEKMSSRSTSAFPSPPGTPPHKKGIIKLPKVVSVDRNDPEKAATASNAEAGTTTLAVAGENASTLTHGAGGSELTLAGMVDIPELTENEKQAIKAKGKKRRTPRLFHRDLSTRANDNNYTKANDLNRQPSKAGVLSNLLRLHANSHHNKSSQPKAPKPPKVKKPKRPGMYSRSAGNSFASILGTYPNLPENPHYDVNSTLPYPHYNQNNNKSNRPSFQIESYSAVPSRTQSPFQSPGASRRASVSGVENYSEYGYPHDDGDYYYGNGGDGGGEYGGAGGSEANSMSLSNEEKMRITNAVADILERQDYILRLAKSMIKYGAPSHRLEQTIDHSAKMLELNLQCIYIPNVMIISFTDYETHTSETHLLRVSAGLNMCKVALVHKVLKMVAHSTASVEEAIMKLDAINSEKDVIPRWLTVLGYSMASFCAAPMFFQGSWVDGGAAALIGCAVSLLVWLSEKVESYSHICEVTMTVVVAFIAEALTHTNVCKSAVKLAGIVIILPGYTITSGILELSSRHMISGSVRLFYAVILSLLLGYGLMIGASLWRLMDPNSPTQTTCPHEPLSAVWDILFVPLFAISLNIWLKAHPKQWLTSTVLSIIGYAISYTTTVYAGAKIEVSSALSAFAIGLLGNLYQRWTRQLMFHAVLCAVFFLVPGSLGLKGAVSLFTDDMTGGVNFAIEMIISAIAISVGLFASALVVYPFGKTRSAQMTF